MLRDNTPPHELYDKCDDSVEIESRLGRWYALDELGYFSLQTNLRLARGRYPGTWSDATRNHFLEVYGNHEGCSLRDLEVAAELVGYFDQVFDSEAVRASADNTPFWHPNLHGRKL